MSAFSCWSQFNWTTITVCAFCHHFFFVFFVVVCPSAQLILVDCVSVSVNWQAAAGAHVLSDKHHCVAQIEEDTATHSCTDTSCTCGVHAPCRDGKVLEAAFCQCVLDTPQMVSCLLLYNHIHSFCQKKNRNGGTLHQWKFRTKLITIWNTFSAIVKSENVREVSVIDNSSAVPTTACRFGFVMYWTSSSDLLLCLVTILWGLLQLVRVCWAINS